MVDKEESVNLDFNYDSFCDMNFKNVSFYSVNDPEIKGNNMIGSVNPGNKEANNNVDNFTREISASKSEKRIDLESLKMLPYYIKKVSQNIKFIDSIINKQSVAVGECVGNSQSSLGNNGTTNYRMVANTVSKSKSASISRERNGNNISNYISTSVSNQFNNSNNSNSSNTNSNLNNLNNTYNNITNIQSIVRKSVDGVKEILNNKKLYQGNSYNASCNVNNLNLSYTSGNHANINTSNNISISNKEAPLVTIANNSTNLTDIKNFAIIEERDEDLFSRPSNILNNKPIIFKKEFNKSITNNKIVKKIVPMQNTHLDGRNYGINISTKSATGISKISKKPVGEIAKKSLVFGSSMPSPTASKIHKKIKIVTSNTASAKKKTSKMLFTHTNNNNNNIIKSSHTLSTNYTPAHNKKYSALTNSTVINSPNELTISQANIASSLCITEYGPSNPLASFKSQKNLHTDRMKYKSSLITKKSQKNLSTIISFKNESNSTNKKKTMLANASLCYNCKCKLVSRNDEDQRMLTRSKSKFPASSTARVLTSSNSATILYNRKSKIQNTSPTYDKTNLTISLISKLNDIGMNDHSQKNLIELFYIFNEINSINNEKKLNVQSLNQTLNNQKPTQTDLLRCLKSLIDDEIEGVAEGLAKTNLSLLSINEIINANHNNNLNINQNQNIISSITNSDFSKNIAKISLIQTKWRENKIKKILYPMMNLDLTYNQLDNFSFANCNKEEVIKMGKLHLYTSLLKSSDKFRNVLSLLNQAGLMWFEFMKNQNIFSTTKSIIKDILLLSDSHLLPGSDFQSAISKIITNDIKIKTN